MKTFQLNGKTYEVEIPTSPTICWQLHDHILERVSENRLPVTIPAILYGLYMLSPQLRDELRRPLAGLRIAADNHAEASIRIADALQMGSGGSLPDLIDLMNPILEAFRTRIPAFKKAEAALKNSEPTPSTGKSDAPSDGGVG